MAAAGEETPSSSHFFETLKSQRRLALVSEVSDAVARGLPPLEPNRFEKVPELDPFEVYAGDGHFHAAAAHDPRVPEDGRKYAVGHLFMLNYRSHALSHLTVADQVNRKKEHEMRALKRMDVDTLRQGAPKRRKVLIVWDRAGIDFRQWERWKQSGGLYFLSREKDNMKLECIRTNAWNREEPRNQGVLSDELVATSQEVSVRRIRYHCPLRDEGFSFLTNELTLPPGVVAHLYRLRWEIEKSFDELKNKLGETKAWATSAAAKTMQAHFLCLAHNLMVRCERDLARAHGVRNEAEIARREERLEKEEKRLAKMGQVVPMLVRALQRLTVRSVKFVRWLRVQLFQLPHQPPAIDVLRQSYAHL
ncbi:MAG: transposase [Chthoniobacteraceae bacterium]